MKSVFLPSVTLTEFSNSLFMDELIVALEFPSKRKYAFEKRLIVKELERNSIHAILTKPQQLSVTIINKYLEFKAKGII